MPTITTVKHKVAWSYANLARAHSALADGSTAYARKHHIVRKRLYYGLINDRMALGSLLDDERVKMNAPRACCYCGSSGLLCVDHLIPRIRGGRHAADNFLWACRSCNSAKGGRDILEWLLPLQRFPSLLVLRRYLKVVWAYCDGEDLMGRELDAVPEAALPFALELLPEVFPPLGDLVLWVPCRDETAG